jgi:NADH-quinone oxidoreductase subunit N
VTALTLPSIHYVAILPELIVLGGALVLLCASALVPRALKPVIGTGLAVAVGVAAFAVAFWQWHCVAAHGASTTLASAVVLDGFAVVATGVIALGIVLSALVAHDYLVRERVAGTEYQVLALASAAGAMIVAQANDLIVIFLGLEILSIGLYVLVAFDRPRRTSSEAALKYFLLGGFASAIFIYGAALTYGATGSTNLSSIAYVLGTSLLLRNGVLLAGLGLLTVGFCFKIAAVPFHLWSPDVYEGAPTPVTGFMAAIVKVGAFAAFLRVLFTAFGTQVDVWRPILWVLVVVTVFTGGALALVQTNIKRLLAYSSIAQAGFILLGLWAGTARGVSGSLYYLMTYAPVVIATFAIVSVVGGAGDQGHALDRYRGLARRQPLVGGAIARLWLSQSGAPFTTGFFAKFAVLAAAVDAGGAPIAVLAMVGAAIAAFFYLRVILLLYADDGGDEVAGAGLVVVPAATGTVVALATSSAVLFGVWATPIAALAQHATLLFIGS